MSKTEVISIKREGHFTQAQANKIVCIINKITQKYSSEVDLIVARIDKLSAEDPDLIELEEKMNNLIKDWHFKIKKLGGVPKGLWLVEFDNGYGYFSWKYPEENIKFINDYDSLFKNRKKLVESSLLKI